ncbi:MAG TPA: RING finger protein [Planctomycetota bacterium]
MIDPLRPEILFVLVASFLAFWLWIAVSGSGSTGVWRELARRLGGRLVIRDLGHRVYVPWRGTEALLSEKPRLRFEADTPGFPGPTTLVSYAEGRKVDGPGAEFVEGSARGLFADLGVLAGRDAFEATLGDRLVIEAPHLGGADEILRFARLGLRVAEHARVYASRSSGVRIVGEGTVHDAECQVCGAGLTEDVVRCARCDTAHHADCWTYVGRCSTYGCGEKVCRPA